jgi:hypothetical protein
MGCSMRAAPILLAVSFYLLKQDLISASLPARKADPSMNRRCAFDLSMLLSGPNSGSVSLTSAINVGDNFPVFAAKRTLELESAPAVRIPCSSNESMRTTGPVHVTDRLVGLDPTSPAGICQKGQKNGG